MSLTLDKVEFGGLAMASSGDPELKGGFSFHQWMKTRVDANRDLESPFSASPPPHEDSFFYIRYPKADGLLGPNKKPGDLTSMIVQENGTLNTNINLQTAKDINRDWSKHTKPCQDVLRGMTPVSLTANPVTVKPKPVGTDDGFKGEGAACGSSVVKVAHKMISSNRSVSQRGFTVAAPAEEDSMDAADLGDYNLAARRGSRSLPVSPMHSPPGSPNSRRKNKNVNGNRYFTSTFEQPTDASNGRSWLLAALIGYKKESDTPSNTSNTLHEEDEVESRLQGYSSLAASVESLGPAPPNRKISTASRTSHTEPTQEPQLAKPAAVFRPKPSEFREMNFWSPTSM